MRAIEAMKRGSRLFQDFTRKRRLNVYKLSVMALLTVQQLPKSLN